MWTAPCPGCFYTDGRRLFEVLMVEGDKVIVENARSLLVEEFTVKTLWKMRLVRSEVHDGPA